MRLSWTNTEWDNFSGVASKDNLLMLNAGNDFLNAAGSGNDGNWRNDRKYYTGDESSINFKLDDLKIRDKATGKIINNNLGYIKSVLKDYELKASDWLSQRNAVNVSSTGYTTNSSDNQSRANKNQNLWFADRMVVRLKEIIKEVENKIAEEEKAKADADAKAKAKAQAEADAKAEADRLAKMKDLNNQLVLAKTPEEKASIQSQIDALAGNVAKGTGSSKMLVYGVVGLVVVVGLYMVFKKKN
jgi:hypothetical protein